MPGGARSTGEKRGGEWWGIISPSRGLREELHSARRTEHSLDDAQHASVGGQAPVGNAAVGLRAKFHHDQVNGMAVAAQREDSDERLLGRSTLDMCPEFCVVRPIRQVVCNAHLEGLDGHFFGRLDGTVTSDVTAHELPLGSRPGGPNLIILLQ